MIWVAGHFGEWIQGLVGGEVALVTLACPTKGVRLSVQEAAQFTLDDSQKLLPPEAAQAIKDQVIGVAPTGGFSLSADLPPGSGAGISTAALVALSRACGIADRDLPALCRAVEGAVDPLMMERPDEHLWASRLAQSLAPLPPPPRATILAGFWGDPERTDPSDRAFPEIDDLAQAWAKGPALAEAARLATLSAERCTALRGPQGDPTGPLAARLGALGWARAHTGSARALIFPPGEAPGPEVLARAGYALPFRFETGTRVGVK